MAKTSKRPATKPKPPSIELRMLQERRAELRRTQRTAREVGQMARSLRSSLRRCDLALSELRDHLNALYPSERDIPLGLEEVRS